MSNSYSYPHVGCVLKFQNELEAEIVQEVGESFLVKFNKQNIEELLDEIGELPTPSYVTEKLKKDEYYQTVYAKKEGSVAAPTAGLHFTFELLKKNCIKGC